MIRRRAIAKDICRRQHLHRNGNASSTCKSSDNRSFASSVAFSGSYDWSDPLQIKSQLHEEERTVLQTAKAFARDKLQPHIIQANRSEEPLNKSLLRDMGCAGLLGMTIPKEYGGAGMNYVSYGLVAGEVESVDSAFRSALSVQSSLVMYPIYEYGSCEELKKKYLPELAKGKLVGCFGLTEPNHGSDPSSMESTWYHDKGKNEYVLNGTKNWITNSPIADILIVWSRHVTTGEMRGFLVDRNECTGDLQTPSIKGKFSLRANPTGMIIMNDVRVPEASMFKIVKGLKGPFGCLNHARYGIAWGALGAAGNSLDIAREYCLQRKQFGSPLAANQLVQVKLANMSTEIAIGRQSCLQVGRLMELGRASPEMISMIKRNSCAKSLDICRQARDMLGGKN